jgi:exonuclease SbcD
MRVLHTSDWHIGRKFERVSLEADQRLFLQWLARTVEEQRVDLVVIAGDIYDRSMPSEDAVELLDEGLDLLRASNVTAAPHESDLELVDRPRVAFMYFRRFRVPLNLGYSLKASKN